VDAGGCSGVSQSASFTLGSKLNGCGIENLALPMGFHVSLKSLIMVLIDPFQHFFLLFFIIIPLDFKQGSAIPVSNVHSG